MGKAASKCGTCCECGISVEPIEWEETLFKDEETKPTLLFFGHNSLQTTSFTVSGNLSFGKDGILGGGVGRTETVQEGKPMAKLFAVETEFRHCCNKDCEIDTVINYDIGPEPGVTHKRCLTEEAERRAGLWEPKQYRCAMCFAEKHPEAFKDLLASVYGRLYIINVSNMTMVDPSWGTL